MRFVIHDEARTEAVAAVRHYRYDVEDEALAHDLAEAIDERVVFIQRFPGAGALVTGFDVPFEVRRFRLRRFPYVLFVAFKGDDAVIAAVAHKRQRPGYWLDRIEP